MSNGGRNPEQENASAADGHCAGEDKGEVVQTSNGEAAVEPPIDRRIQIHLGRKLKEAYEDLVREPVPEKFHQLLEELERKEKKQ